MIRASRTEDGPEDAATPRAKSPIANGHGKMSPQAAVGYGRWPDEAADGGRQSKHRDGSDNGKRKTIRTHRTGDSA